MFHSRCRTLLSTRYVPRPLAQLRDNSEEVAKRGYNLDMKNPHQAEELNHDPDELLANYAKQQDAIQSLRGQLKVILAEALGKGA